MAKEKDFQNLIGTNVKEQLSSALRIAIGYRSISQFAQDCRMVDANYINDILNKKISVLPEREVLRVIERASQGRVTYSHLCQICNYTKYDPNEDMGWAKYFPERGSIYLADLGFNNMDSEQEGIRPVLIIQNNLGNRNSSTISIAPLTSKKKNPLSVHVELTQHDGMRQDSTICIEQTRVVSKRRLFYNGFPIKILKLSEEKIFQVNTAIEKQFGIVGIMYDRSHSFKLVEQIKALENNIKIKQSRDLIDMFDEKIEELAIYCKKYSRNIEGVLREYEVSNSYICAM